MPPCAGTLQFLEGHHYTLTGALEGGQALRGWLSPVFRWRNRAQRLFCAAEDTASSRDPREERLGSCASERPNRGFTSFPVALLFKVCVCEKQGRGQCQLGSGMG